MYCGLEEGPWALLQPDDVGASKQRVRILSPAAKQRGMWVRSARGKHSTSWISCPSLISTKNNFLFLFRFMLVFVFFISMKFLQKCIFYLFFFLLFSADSGLSSPLSDPEFDFES